MPLSLLRLCLVFIVVGGVCIQAQTPKESKGRSQNQQAPANQQAPTPQPQATPIQVSVEQPKADDAGKGRQEQQEQPKGWFTPEWATVLLNFLLLILILIQTAVYGYQLSEMRKMKGVSERQADTMETQVGAMQAQLEVMQAQTASMQDSLTETRNIVAQNERAVAASEIQARVAEENAAATKEAFYIAERAYISIKQVDAIHLVVGDDTRIDVWLVNGGRTPAWNVTSRSKFILHRELVKEATWDEPPSANESGSIMPAGAERMVKMHSRDFKITQEQLDAIRSGDLKFMVVGDVCYRDFWNKEQVLTFRGVYYPTDNMLIYY